METWCVGGVNWILKVAWRFSTAAAFHQDMRARSVMPHKKPSLWLKRAAAAREPGGVWSGLPPRATNSRLQSACENKAGRQWGSNQSCAVTLSGMLMSLQVTGGQWAPHGPTPSPLAPCVSLSVHTHKETPLAQGHISNVLPIKRTGSPLTDMFVLCDVCWCTQMTLGTLSCRGNRHCLTL